MRRFNFLLLASLLVSCSSDDETGRDPIVTEPPAFADSVQCQRACDVIAATGEGTCGECAGSCDAAPRACVVYFTCVLEPQTDPTVCDDVDACEPVLDPACASWRDPAPAGM
jgi:hypothetical protein